MTLHATPVRTIPALHDDAWWDAVQRRDPDYDARFVYAVRSTGIFCRPTCPSRRPQRQNVLFFALPEAARQAGFRPCRRCRPTDREDDPQVAMVRRACRLLEQDLEDTPTLASLGAELHVHPHHLQRTFKRLTGVTPRQYADAVRLARLKEGLRAGASVTQALYDAGFGSSSRLYERAEERLGMRPGAYRRGGAGLRIGYTAAPCDLGILLVAATGHGICAVSLGDDATELEAALAMEYPAATIEREDALLQPWVGAIVHHLRGGMPHLDLPLDVRATAFQRRVWDYLRTIPYGTTRTYGQIAAALGTPLGARAVARACAVNPVSVVVPCHRVVREDGGLGGYRWGLQRKQALLDRERDSGHALSIDHHRDMEADVTADQAG